MRYGNQEPTFTTKIEYASTDGREVVEWFDEMGYLSYPCQENEMLLFCCLWLMLVRLICPTQAGGSARPGTPFLGLTILRL